MSGNKQQTSATSSEPWGAAQGALKLGLSDAEKAYKSGIGSQPNTASTVVPYAQQTMQGLAAQQKRGTDWQPLFDQQMDRVRTNANNGGLNELQQQQVRRLQPMADGSMLNGNPYIDEVIGNTSRDIAGASNLAASAAGRYGSGAHQNVTERNIGDVSSRMRMQDYGTERGYMQDAIGSLFNAGQQQQGNINANTGAMADAYQAAMMPSQTMMDVGGAYEDLFGRQLNDKLRIFGEQQNQPWNQIGRLNAIASGAGSMGGSGTATAQGPSRLSSGLGGAIGGGTLFGPLGALGGGLLGAFG